MNEYDINLNFEDQNQDSFNYQEDIFSEFNSVVETNPYYPNFKIKDNSVFETKNILLFVKEFLKKAQKPEHKSKFWKVAVILCFSLLFFGIAIWALTDGRMLEAIFAFIVNCLLLVIGGSKIILLYREISDNNSNFEQTSSYHQI
ncbi:hypothetical protein M0813_13580 [Anaeramoeba flamelloides]|uniref:Uncharacterized protein n=1 Tax=Anaeramoeba flamelloides TaxID=1746091 RepID=A0AAV7ZFX6_9EUKA|nr:hypothetical protein M0812_15180 [Anaeramoeba flamelloides]KAJ6253083.1 hypothetical protein M0813_13580 [Anaeramoeba flamelloides]